MSLMSRSLIFLSAAAIGLRVLSAEPDLSSFAKTFDILVSDSAVAEGTVLTDFPVLVRLSAAIDGFDYGDFKQARAGDLVFADESGNVLDHEIDTWDEEGESLVWVKIPAFSRSTRIRVHYGRADHVSENPGTSVWKDFTAVFHLGEASGTAYDSTANALNAEPTGEKTEEMVAYDAGAVGKARVNQTGDSSVHNRLAVPDYDSFGLGGRFTFSGWFNVSSQDGWNRLVSRKAAWGQPGMEVELNASTYGHLDIYGNDGGNLEASWPESMAGGWAQLVFVYSGTTLKYYANGKLIAEKNDITEITDNGEVLAIGNNAAGNERSFFGRYDEIRICPGALSPERIAADYATVSDRNFLVCGAVLDNARIDPSKYSKFLKLSVADGAVGDGVGLAGFPALVRLSGAIEGFDYGDFADEGGGDLVFADMHGRLLPREIDTWNPQGESLVWVKIPLLVPGTEIYAYWGRVDAPAGTASKTWSAFAGVWHMNASGPAVEIDVSGNNRDAVPSSASKDGWGGNPTDTTGQMTTVEGVAGTGRRNQDAYAGYIKNRLLVPSCDLGEKFTVSGWFYQKFIYGYHRLITCKESASEDGWHTEWAYGGTEGEGTILSVFGNGNSHVNADVGSIKGRWAYLTLVFDSDGLRVYSDGVLCAEGNISPVKTGIRAIAIGGSPEGSEPSFEGFYDEVRIAKTVLSAERIAADFATVDNRGFFDFGAVGVPAADSPVVTAPVLDRDESGAFTVTVEMLSGTGTLYARFVSGDETVDVALSDGVVSGNRRWTIPVPPSLLGNRTYAVYAVGVNAAGSEIVAAGADRFYNGVLTVAKTADASENGPVEGVFTVSRVDVHGELKVNYALSGDAVSGVDYAEPSAGTVIIPAGSASAEFRLTPLVNADINADTRVAFSFASGFYCDSPDVAELTIANLAPVARNDFAKRLDLTFPMTFLDEGEVLEDFPVLVRLSTAIEGFSYSDFRLAAGGDMFFTDPRGEPLPFEIDSWDENGESLVWVSVPELKRGTAVRMYYGGGANPAGVKRAKWPGYAGVWHMGEDAGDGRDSTANGLDAVAVLNRAQAGDMAAVADGAVGKGRVNQDSTSFYSYDYENYGKDPEVRAKSRRCFMRVKDYSALAVGNRFTFSGWFRTVGGTEHGEYLVCRTATGDSWGWNVRRCASQGSQDARVTVGVADGGGDYNIPDLRGGWVHLLFSFDVIRSENGDLISEVSVYGNGEKAERYSGSGRGSTYVRDNRLPLTFGNKNDAFDGYGYYGHYDELRLKRTAVSASWAKAEYRTVADSSFVTFSAVMSARPGLMLIVR